MERDVYFFDAHRCYVVRWHGVVTGPALIRHWDEIARDARAEPGFAALHDARGTTFVLDRAELGEQAERYRSEVEPKLGFGRVGILSDRQETSDAARRLLSVLELDGAIVTGSETEARRWVGLPEGIPLPYDS